MRQGIVLLLLLGAVVASAQRDHRNYPERFNICRAPGNCIVVTKQGDDWVGLTDGGTTPAWKFQIDDFRLAYLKLTGVSVEKDAEGRNQTVVVQGKPPIGQDGVAYCKARYTVGHKSTSQKVTVTWPSTYKIPNFAP